MPEIRSVGSMKVYWYGFLEGKKSCLQLHHLVKGQPYDVYPNVAAVSKIVACIFH